WLDAESNENKLQIRETLNYLADTYGKESIQRFFSDNIQDVSLYNTFNDLKLNSLEYEMDNLNHKVWYSFTGGAGVEQIDINTAVDYSSCVLLHYRAYKYEEEEYTPLEIKSINNLLNIKIIPQNKVLSFDIKDIALKHQRKYHVGNSVDSAIPLKPNGNEDCLLVITETGGNYYPAKDSLEITTLHGILFYK
ncbi:MAG: hypothetical protein LBS52_10285, partial [Dysgonamonadaceae bacterium]|nr:hypothetical protein [Dysgonamonadaceae bacterium]